MRVIYFVVVFLVAINAYSQSEGQEIGLTDIEFKAKLFTVSEYGISTKPNVLKYIEEQKVTHLNSTYKHFIFFKIDYNQPYSLTDGSVVSLTRYCSYYIAYNKIDCKYYKLGGFDSVDIDEFIKDLKLQESVIFKSLDDKEIEGISIQCLYLYYETKEKQRIKKGNECFEQCSKVTTTIYRQYSDK